MDRLEALIRLVLDRQRKIEALLLPWREEIAMHLQSASSSRMLARTYGAQDGGRWQALPYSIQIKGSAHTASAEDIR
jgi:phage terminase large subunit GpA-like protein